MNRNFLIFRMDIDPIVDAILHYHISTTTGKAPNGFMIKEDIKGCFDNIDHGILLEIIGRNIKDQKLLKLLRLSFQLDICKSGNITKPTRVHRKVE